MLYASGEESERQIKLRAQRLGAENPGIHLFAETDVRRILEAAEAMKPALLLVDSIQTLFDPEFESPRPARVSQVRGCATLLARWAKATGTPAGAGGPRHQGRHPGRPQGAGAPGGHRAGLRRATGTTTTACCAP